MAEYSSTGKGTSSAHEQLKSSVHRLQVQESILQRNARELEEKVKIREQIIESKSQMEWVMVKLEAMGFGLKQLTWIYNVVKEIAEANGFSETDDYAVKMFLDQVERNYDTLLGFEKRSIDRDLQSLYTALKPIEPQLQKRFL